MSAKAITPRAIASRAVSNPLTGPVPFSRPFMPTTLPAGACGGDAPTSTFDPGRITDRATYADSTRTSAGIRHVVVNGTFVVRDGELVLGAEPGKPVRAAPR